MAYLALTLSMFVGCGQDLPAPAPTIVAPDHAWNGRDAVVAITGRHFYPDVSVDAVGRSEPDIDVTYRAFLVDAGGAREALAGVTLSDDLHIDAIVPKGLPIGRYDLLVQGPSGVEGTLSRAFTVTDTLADRLVVDAADITYQVREWATADVTLASPQGDRVLQDLLVEVTLESEDGEAEARFADGALFDQTALTDGRVGIRGRLGADGWASVSFAVDTPDLVTLTAAPADLGSGIAEGGLKLEYRPGDDRRIVFELPDEPFVAEAGRAFMVHATVVDQFGNRVDDEAASFTLRDRCQTTSLPVVVLGQGEVPLVLNRATGVASCVINALEAVEFPSASPEFAVDPGPLHHYEVATSRGPFVAGEGEYAFVVGADRFSNAVSGLGGRVTITDTAGGVSPERVDCNVVGAGAVCTFQPTRAENDVRLVVDGPTGAHGESEPYDVVAGPGASIDVAVPAGTAVAGAPVHAALTVADAWGNELDRAAVGLVAFADGGGAVACVFDLTGGGGGIGLACTLTRASLASVLSATLTSGVSGASSPFVVTNGPLSRVELSPSALSNTAGTAVRIALDGYDAWSNPALVLADPVVSVTDSGGDVDTLATLAGGNGAVVVTFTRAGSTVVTVSQGGLDLGSSAPMVVVPAVANALVVDVVEPWGWVDAPLTASVTAVDVYGNTATLDTTFTAETSQGVSASGALTEGRGSAAVAFAEFDARATITATTAGGLTGTSSSLMVAEVCASGPTAKVTFGGYSTGIACVVAGTSAGSISASSSGSSAGAAALSRYAFASDGEDATIASVAVSTLSLSRGRHEVAALVVDDAGCGAEASGVVWVGDDDGNPVGPIVASASDVDLGDTAVIEVSGATFCTRDPADGAVVRVRSDLGAVGGATGTGLGLGLTLDSAGAASFEVDTSAANDGGTATVTIAAFDAEAHGVVSFVVEGDDRRPTIFGQSPTGYVTGGVDAVILQFSEPLLATSVTVSAFSITDAAGGEVSLDEATLDAEGGEVTLWLATPVEGADGPFTVAASTALRDEAGNRLDGAWSGAASAYAGFFGGSGSGPAKVSACAASTSAFRPDGDDGSDEEADTVEVSAVVSSAPVWWIRTVARRGGAVIVVLPTAGSAAGLTWTWDGRDAAGRVVDDGRYLLRTDTEDGLGERGGACTVNVDITNGEAR